MANLADCKNKMTELYLVLSWETRDLKRGDTSRVEKYLHEKTSGLNALTEMLASLEDEKQAKALSPELGRLHKLARENGILLQGVYNGVRSAKQRIDKIKNGKSYVGAYGPKGGGLYFHEDAARRETSV